MNNVVLMTHYVMGKMRRIYFMSYPENKRDYKKSRACYTVGDTAAQAIVQFAGGTFLVALMTALGLSDGNIGILSSFAALAAVAQLISITLVPRMKKNKLFVCLLVLQKFWLGFMFFIPLLPLNASLKRYMVIVCYCVAQICIQISMPATIDWIANLVPDKLRGRYFSIKDSVATFFVVTTMLIMGVMVDYMEKININYAFIALGIMTSGLAIANVIAFSMMKEPRIAMVDQNGKELHGTLARRAKAMEGRKLEAVHLGEEFVIALKDNRFCKALFLNCIWMTAFYIALPFNASYQIKELKLPYTYIMVLSFITSLLRIYLTPKAGKMADRLGMARVLRWALIAMGGHFLFMALSIPQNAYVFAAIASIFSSLGWVFIGIGLLGIQLEFIKKEKRIIQYAFLCIISGVYGFVVSFVGGNIINFLQSQNISIGGFRIYAQQITNVIGMIFIACTVLFLKYYIETDRVKKSH